jgi:membrane protein
MNAPDSNALNGRNRSAIWRPLRGSGGLWDIEIGELGWLGRQAVGGLRVLHLVARGYRKDDCQLHASALTYYTLMSLVPLVALGLALARVFGGDELAHARIRTEIARLGTQLAAARPEAASHEAVLVGEFIQQLNQYGDRLFQQIGQISFGTLGGIGLVILLWMAISMLSQVEHSFNRVWDAPPRSLWRKCADYLTLIVIVPFLALAASTVPVADLAARHLGGWFTGTIGTVGASLPVRQGSTLLLTTLLFMTVFLFVPNTRVRLKPALIGGVVTAVAFLVWLRICMGLQVGVIKYSKLYGGFAVLPILLAWVYASWQIILFGAELSFACQHAATYGREQGARQAGMRARWQLALGLVVELADAMRTGRLPVHAVSFAQRNQLSVRLLNDVLDDLLQAGLVDESASHPGCFLLRHDPSTLTIATVVRAILDRGSPPEALGLNALNPAIRRLLAQAEGSLARVLDTPVLALAEETAAPSGKNAS